MHTTERQLRAKSIGILHDISSWVVSEQLRQLELALKEEKYRPNQARVPAGNSEGGQWTSEGGGSGSGLVARKPDSGGGYAIEENPKNPLPDLTDLIGKIPGLPHIKLPKPGPMNLTAEEAGMDAESDGIDPVYPIETLLSAIISLPTLGARLLGLSRLFGAADDMMGGADSSQSPREILMPGGQPAGSVGNKPGVRIMQGGDKGARDLYNQLGQGGSSDTPVNYNGQGTRLPNGDWVGYRPVSRSGPPTVDTNVNNVPIKKIKFPE